MEETSSNESEVTQLEEEVTQEPEQSETQEQKEEQKQVQAMLKKFKLKVDGQEIEREYDLNDEASLVKKFQLAEAAQKRMAEAQEAKRKAYELMQMVDGDLTGFLKKHPKGHEVAEQLLLEKMQQEMMTPEQRQMAELKGQLEKYQRAEKEAQEKAEQERIQQLEAKFAQEYQQKIISALEKSGLPKTPEMGKRMAYLLQKNIELGLDLDADDLALAARTEVLGLFGSLTKGADPETLLQLLDKETLKKIDKHRVQELKKKQIGGSPSKSLTQSSYKPSPRSSKVMSWDDWQEEVSKRIKS